VIISETSYLISTKNTTTEDFLQSIWSGQFSFTTPESDFTSDVKYNIMDHIDKDDIARSSLAYTLSFIENDDNCVSLLFTDEMKLQLANVGHQK
jgi:hypothetical protein